MGEETRWIVHPHNRPPDGAPAILTEGAIEEGPRCGGHDAPLGGGGDQDVQDDVGHSCDLHDEPPVGGALVPMQLEENSKVGPRLPEYVPSHETNEEYQESLLT